jgi:hypothetical protein
MEDVICPRCGGVNDYRTEKVERHLKAVCNNCKIYIKFLPQEQTKPTIFFGKYKGRHIETMTAEEEVSYLKWLITVDWIKPKQREQVEAHLTKINRI